MLRVRVGCEFVYQAIEDTPTVWQVRPRTDGTHQVVWDSWGSVPSVPIRSYLDSYGNTCDRLTMGPGLTRVRYDAVMEVPPGYDEVDEQASQVELEDLPDEALVYLLPSRYCWPDVVEDRAWDLFGDHEPGWPRVQAVSDWVHEHIRYQSGSSTSVTTAADVLEAGQGVCRDFAHLGVTFLRSLNVPARYVCGYIPDIGPTPQDEPMDFCSWLEAYLGDRWWTFDPRNNVPRMGRVVIGRGRDAVDVAMVTSYGEAVLQTMTVWADPVEEEAADPSS